MLECFRYVIQFLNVTKYESPSSEQRVRVRKTGNTRDSFVFSNSVEWNTNLCEHSCLRFTKQCRGHRLYYVK